jgi:hypothetical protein
MTNWIKNISGKWIKSNNDISSVDFSENLKPTTNLNIAKSEKAIIYIPTHNINDVYEWYRLFNDSYAFTDNFDKYGFGIHAWFDKSRGQSIKGWFPNLIEVKASSSNTLKYYNDGISYFRSSVDYINNFLNIEQLTIDGVVIYDNEKVLLKNQFYEEIQTFTIESQLSNDNIYYAIITPGDEKYFEIGNDIVFRNTDNQFITDKIVLINYTNITGIDYAIIKTINTHINVTELADVNKGNWVEFNFKTENGIYLFNNNSLTLIDEMFDKYKIYSQIVYSYQGITNMNKEFYLKRVENKNDDEMYSLFPRSGTGYDLNYKEGSAYLIKCELDYSLNIDGSDLVTLPSLQSCCECIANINFNVVNHPITLPPYNIQTDAFRMLIMDNTVAEKVFATTTSGVGKYILENDINFNNATDTLEFYTVDKDNVNNFLTYYQNDKYYGRPSNANFDFRYINHTISQTLTSVFTTSNTIIFKNLTTIIYDNELLGPFVTGETIIFSNGAIGTVSFLNDNGSIGVIFAEMSTDINLIENLSFVGQTSGASAITDTNLSYPNLIPYQVLTQVVLTYNGMNYFPLSSQVLQNGDFIDIKLDVTINGIQKTLLDYQFINIMTLNKTITDLNLLIYPALDINMLNDFNTNLQLANDVGNSLELTLDLINTYGSLSGTTIDNSKSLIDNINKSIIGKVYNFTYIIDDILDDMIIHFNGLNRSTKYKWHNMGIQFTDTINIFNIEHSIDSNYRPYFYDYTIEKYLSDYLGIQNIEYYQNVISLPYNNILNNPNRLGIGGSNKLPGFGNIIYFGINYKTDFIDKIKSNTYIKFAIPSIAYLNELVWVNSIVWDDINNIGIINLASYIFIPGTAVITNIEFSDTINTISSKLENVFNKELNSISDPNFNYNAIDTNVAYKPDTASYAEIMLQWGLDVNNNKNMDVYNNISTAIFKDYNEPRVTFTKRDRNFKFLDNTRIAINAATVGVINLLLPPSIVDGVLLNTNDLILVKNQSNTTENGIYEFISIGLPLIRYNDFNNNIFWEISSGTVNINKSFEAVYTAPLIYGTTFIGFINKNFRRKSDPRLTIKPIEIAKLGVDNDTQPWKKINTKYDTHEIIENLLTIQPGINSINEIRFIDGLTEYNILNDIAGQGIYIWILGEGVLTENAVVGCTQINGTGTGELIWYTGTWVQGTWCNGIWIQGTWIDGIWVNGTHHAYPIQDFFYYVYFTPTINNTLSIWENGTWLNGTWTSGIAENINWYNGIFNNGIINDGTWLNGVFNNGIINYIIWTDGQFHGGDFETGLWMAGTLSELNPTIPARFGTGSNGLSLSYKDRAVWLSGTFDSGQFHSGNNTIHNGSIFYSGTMINADFYGGSFITGSFQNGIWYDGVWFGGYYATITNSTGNTKIITIQPDQYDDVLGLSTLTDYLPNTAHRLHTFDTSFILLATPTTNTAFSIVAFINRWDLFNNTLYPEKTYVLNSATDTVLTLNISVNTVIGTNYQAPNPITNTLDGNPFICAKFVGIWKGGIFLNGYFQAGTWETGAFINGYFADGVFGINQI